MKRFRHRRARSGLLRLVRVAGLLLVAAGVVSELRKPKAERTWHGHLFGFIPYDFRPPTLGRLKESLWNPDDHHLLVGRPLGVGWSVNFAEVVRRFAPGSGGSSDGGNDGAAPVTPWPAIPSAA